MSSLRPREWQVFVVRPVPGSVFPTEHFNGACANCLPGGGHRCTVGESSQRVHNDLKLISVQGRGAARATSSRSRRPSSSVPAGSISLGHGIAIPNLDYDDVNSSSSVYPYWNWSRRRRSSYAPRYRDFESEFLQSFELSQTTQNCLTFL